MIIEVFVFDEELLKKDLDNYNFRLYIPERGVNRASKIHPNDHSWFHYYKPIQVETSMYELNVISSGEDFGTVPFAIIEIDNDILYMADFPDRLYSYTETKRRDKSMNKSTFDSNKGFGKMLERELKLKSLLKV